MSGTDIAQRMEQAMNAHDLDAFVACFADDVDVKHPIHPQRGFVGNENVRKNWSGLFAHVPDLVGKVLQFVVDGDQVWTEWDIHGTTRDGERYHTAGVAILRVRGDRIASVNFYLDNVDGAVAPV